MRYAVLRGTRVERSGTCPDDMLDLMAIHEGERAVEIGAALPDDVGPVAVEASLPPRDERSRRLAASDWTQLADVPEMTRKLWAPYRQALRDMTLAEMEAGRWPPTP
jgi:hypothetical protein